MSEDQERFIVQNVKCGGCVQTIGDGVGALPGVERVDVEIDTGEVRVTGRGLERADLAAKLAELGYPEAE